MNHEGWDVWGLLKSIFPPWEIEEIVCIHEFVMQTYRTTPHSLELAWASPAKVSPTTLGMEPSPDK